MSQYFGGVQALSGGLANQEQLRRNAIRKLEAEGKIEKGSLDREMASIDHDGEATKKKKKEVGKIEETGKEYQGGKNSGEGTTTTAATVDEAPPTYTSQDGGPTEDREASRGVKSAVRDLFKK